MIRRLSIFVAALIAGALTALSFPPSTASDASVPTTTVQSPSLAAGSR
jgi:apolipoprotein N-acyltransferase